MDNSSYSWQYSKGITPRSGVITFELKNNFCSIKVHTDMIIDNSNLVKTLLTDCKNDKASIVLPALDLEALDHYLCMCYRTKFRLDKNSYKIPHAWKLVEVADFLDSADSMYSAIETYFARNRCVAPNMLWKAEACKTKMPALYQSHVTAAAARILERQPLKKVMSQNTTELSLDTVLAVWDAVETSRRLAPQAPDEYLRHSNKVYRRVTRQHTYKYQSWDEETKTLYLDGGSSCNHDDMAMTVDNISADDVRLCLCRQPVFWKADFVCSDIKYNVLVKDGLRIEFATECLEYPDKRAEFSAADFDVKNICVHVEYDSRVSIEDSEDSGRWVEYVPGTSSEEESSEEDDMSDSDDDD